MQNPPDLRTDPKLRQKVSRLFYILRGLFQGATTHKNFAVLFDWLYPEYFGIVEKCMTIFI